MADHVLQVPSAFGLTPPSDIQVDLPDVRPGERVVVDGGSWSVTYHMGEEGVLHRAHLPYDCWCGGSLAYRGDEHAE